MSSKSSQKTTTTPYDPVAIKGAEGDLSSAYGQTQGTISQYSPALNTAIQQIQQNIAHPPQFMTDAASNLDKTINGYYLDPSTNPYSAGMAKLIADRTQGEYNSTFGASGRTHGGLAALLSSQGVGDALNNFYGNIYNTERGYQNAATMGAPAFHQGQYADINELFPAVSNTAMLPLNAANSYAGGLSGLISPYTTQKTRTKQGFGLQQALGLGLMGLNAAFPMGFQGGGGMSAAMPIAVNPGTANYFANSPFGGNLGYTAGFGG